MSKHFASILAAAFLCNPEVASMSLVMQGEEDKHGISLHHKFTDEDEDAHISLISQDVVLLQSPTPLPTASEEEEKIHRDELTRRFVIATCFWIIGLCLGLVGQSVVAVGLLIQKMALTIPVRQISMGSAQGPPKVPSAMSSRSVSELADDVGVGYTMSGTWWMGFVVFIMGHLVCWMALGFAPQSVLACLQSWNMVIVMLLGPRMVGETVPTGAFRYCGLIIFGCIIVVICGPQQSLNFEFNFISVVDGLYHWYWIGPAAVVFLLVALSRSARISPAYAFIILSAVCAWYASTLAKVTAVLAVGVVVYGISVEWGILLILLVFILLAVFQLHFMNMAMRHGDATLVIPLYESLSMIGNIVFGAIFWHEFYGIGVARFAGFIIGVTIIVAGLSFLTKAKLATENDNKFSSLVADDALEDA